MSINIQQTLRMRWDSIFGTSARTGDRRPACAAKPAPQKPFILPAYVKIGTIAGSMKSGTTWLMNLLDDHPQVLSRGEMHLLGEMPVDDPINRLLLSWYPARWPTFQQLMRHSQEFNTWLLKANDFWNEAYRGDPKAVVDALQTDLLRFVFEWRASYVMRTSAAEKDIRWIFDKSPIHFTDYYELFNRCFAGYGRAIIHLVRDPREVALSLWYHLRYLQFSKSQEHPESLEPADRQACQELLALEESQLTRERHFFTVPDFLRLTLRHWTEVNWNLHEAGKRGDCPCLLVHYRDLKRDTTSALGHIFEFLGLPFDPKALAEYGKPLTADGKERSSTLRKGTLGEWRKWFNAEDHEIVRAECADLMKVFGYEEWD